MQNDIQDKLSSIPGVTSAAFGSAMPMEGFGSNLGVVNSGVVRADDRAGSGVGHAAAALVQVRLARFLQDCGHAG